MNASKRTLLAGVAFLVIAGSAGSALAQSGDADAPLSSSRILDTLSRDVVLDKPKPGQSPAQHTPSTQPALDLRVQFEFNSAELQPQGKRQLDELGKALTSKALANWGFELAGHTDAVGSAEYNLKLSLERANAVKNYLVVKHGLNPNRLVPLGFGFSRPVSPADPAAAVNRRVEVRRVALANGRAVTLGASEASKGQTVPAAQQPTTGGRLVTTP